MFIAPEEPVATVKVAGPPKGREIVHYGDMFSKKATPAVDEKKTTVKLTKSASESVIRPRLQLNKGPPKVTFIYRIIILPEKNRFIDRIG